MVSCRLGKPLRQAFLPTASTIRAGPSACLTFVPKEQVAMHRKVALVVGAFALIGCSRAPADEVLLANLYGSGVHAYNRGDFRSAHADFAAAIQDGSTDPRTFYFRGLT